LWDGFEVLTAVNTKIAVFWVVTPCSLVEVYQRFGGNFCLHHQGLNVGKLLPDYPTLQARRQPFSCCEKCMLKEVRDAHKILGKSMKGRSHMRDLGVNEMNWILKK
jgi:hypothetical protein